MDAHSFFLNPRNKSHKTTIYSAENLQIETSIRGITSQQFFNIIIDKHNSQNAFQIRLTNTTDKSKMFVCSIDAAQFEIFKVEQSLHVSFEGFVKHLIQMLDNCRKASLNMLLFAAENATVAQLQFYEKGTFKNLVHISLPIEPAPMELILFALNQSFSMLQEQNQMAVQKCASLEMEVMQRNERIDRLNDTIKMLKMDISEQEQAAIGKSKEQICRLEQEFKQINDSKEFQRQELEKQIAAFRARVDSLINESHTLGQKLGKESAQATQLRNENQRLKESLISAKEQYELLKAEQSGQRTSVQRNEHIQNELRKQVQSLQDKVNLLEKQKSEVLAEIDAEKNICQIKRNGLKMATEDICNANSIIRKQAAEIVALKKKIDWRTEVALKQEQVISERERECEKFNDIVEFVGGSVQHNGEQIQDIDKKIETLKLRSDFLERKYKTKIADILTDIPGHLIEENRANKYKMMDF